MAWTLRGIFIFLLAAAGTVGAQGVLPEFETRTGFPLPQAGIYYDPAQPGVGFSFDVGLDGSVLGGFGTYDAEGRSIFYTVQGRISRDGLLDADRATIGVLRSPLYLSRRIGARDAPDARVVTESVPALGEAVVRFLEPRRLTLEIAGQRWDMQRMVLTEDPSHWIGGRFLLLVEPRAEGSPRPPVLAQVAIGPPLRIQALPAPADGVCRDNSALAEARMVECETGCEAFQQWAGGPGARVLVWPNEGSSTVQLGRFVPGAGAALVPLAAAVQYTLQPSPLSLDALPLARGCDRPGEPLRLYRRAVPQYVVQTPTGPASVRYALGSLRGGTWWDPSRPGRGLVIDVGGRVDAPVAIGMVGVFDFSDDGSADFSTLQGEVRSANPAMLWPEVLASPIYTHRDGQCITCPWRAPVTVAGSTGMQLLFEGGNFGVLTVRRMLGGLELARNQYVRFPIDRSPFDEVQGRWLLRIEDPALTSTSTEFAVIGQRIPAYAEVVIEPLVDAESSPLLGFSPLYRVACLADCGDFERWKALAGSPTDPAPREVVLWFNRERSVFIEPGPLDPQTGRLSIFTRSGRELAFIGGASYMLNLAARDRYSTIGVGRRAAIQDEDTNAGTIDLFRNPPRVFAD